MAQPDWQQIVQWDSPFYLRDLIANPNLVPELPGIYAFNLDFATLKTGRVLYVGETNQQGGFRARFRGDYLHPDPANARTRHKGALFLQDYRMQNATTEIFVRFAPLESDKGLLRELEAAIMQYYQAWFNSRDMKADTRFDTF